MQGETAVKVDRYTKFVLTIIALALSTLAFKDIIAPQPAVAAASTEEVVQFPGLRGQVRSAIKTCLDGASIIGGFLYTRSSC
jgi:hypothetical protein